MTTKRPYLKVRFHFGRSLLFGTSVRAFVLDTLFEIGHSREDAAAPWAVATSDPGPGGSRARQMIEQTTEIRITVETL